MFQDLSPMKTQTQYPQSRLQKLSQLIRGGSSNREILLRNETILITTDIDGERGLLAGALERAGYKVLEASGGAEGLKVIQKYRGEIKLILTDVVMSGMDGIEFIEHTKRFLPKGKVLLISMYRRHRESFIVRVSGADQMELNIEQLVKHVKEILEGKNLRTCWRYKPDWRCVDA